MSLFLDWCLKTLGADLAQPVRPRPVSDPVSDIWETSQSTFFQPGENFVDWADKRD